MSIILAPRIFSTYIWKTFSVTAAGIKNPGAYSSFLEFLSGILLFSIAVLVRKKFRKRSENC